MLLLSYVVYQNLQVLQTYFKIIIPRAARKILSSWFQAQGLVSNLLGFFIILYMVIVLYTPNPEPEPEPEPQTPNP